MLSLRDEMKYWLNRDMPGCEAIVDRLTEAQLQTMIETRYEGGMARFESIYGTSATSHSPVVHDSDLDPQLALRREFRQVLGRPFAIAACHEMVRLDYDCDTIRLVIRVIEEEERPTRLIQHRASLRLLEFDANTSELINKVDVPDGSWDHVTYLNSHRVKRDLAND